MMSLRQGFRTRTPVKQERVLQLLRKQIVDGKLGLGAQLPTRQKLEDTFQVSAATLQRALDRLIQDGLVYARGSSGTFVSENPPFISRYGLVFPGSSSAAPSIRFYTALRNEADRVARATASARSMAVYFGGDGHSDSEDFKRLLKDVLACKVAGLIIIGSPEPYEQTAIMQRARLPRILIGWAHGDVPVARLEPALVDRALDFLGKRGRRKIAWVGHAAQMSDRSFVAGWMAAIQRRKMQSAPHWMQGLSISSPMPARNLVHLMMHPSMRDRPDGLVIADDNLVEYATAGLIDAQIRVPGDVDVAAHCNFPWPAPSVLPVNRLGYDARECLRVCMDSIDRQRAGRRVPGTTMIPVRFEEEIAP
jgi:DNA-binding LacI/PurR family transcriptional regulator